MPEDLPDNMPEDMPDRMADGMPEDMPEHMPEDMPEDMPEHLPEDMPEHLPEDMPGRMPEDMPDRMPDRMPENMSDRMPEDLPVTKCINVMVGITRSKVINLIGFFNHQIPSHDLGHPVFVLPFDYVPVRFLPIPAAFRPGIDTCHTSTPTRRSQTPRSERRRQGGVLVLPIPWIFWIPNGP